METSALNYYAKRETEKIWLTKDLIDLDKKQVQGELHCIVFTTKHVWGGVGLGVVVFDHG